MQKNTVNTEKYIGCAWYQGFGAANPTPAEQNFV